MWFPKKLSTGEWYTIETKSAVTEGDTLAVDYPMHTRASGEFRLRAIYTGGFEIVSPTIVIIPDENALKIDYQHSCKSDWDGTYRHLIYSITISGGTMPEYLDKSLIVKEHYFGLDGITRDWSWEEPFEQHDGTLSSHDAVYLGYGNKGQIYVTGIKLTFVDADGLTYVIDTDRDGIVLY